MNLEHMVLSEAIRGHLGNEKSFGLEKRTSLFCPYFVLSDQSESESVCNVDQVEEMIENMRREGKKKKRKSLSDRKSKLIQR